jgi:hypothetical protein
VSEAKPTIAGEVGYLRTGETDPHHAAWPGNGFMERPIRAHEDLRGALVREIRRLAEGLAHEPLPEAAAARRGSTRSRGPRSANSAESRIVAAAGR